jgi:hypothetical protein
MASAEECVDENLKRIGVEYFQSVCRLDLSEKNYLSQAKETADNMNKLFGSINKIKQAVKLQDKYHLALKIIKDFLVDAEKLYYIHGLLLIQMLQKAGYTLTQISIDAECEDKTLIRDDYLDIDYAVRDKLLLHACKEASWDNNFNDKKYILELFDLMVLTRELYKKIVDAGASMIKTQERNLLAKLL